MLSKSLFTNSLVRLLQVLILFVTIKAMTSFLPAAEVGALFILQALGTGLATALHNPLIEFAKTHLNAWKNGKVLTSGTGKILISLLLASVLGALITLSFHFGFHPGNFAPINLVGLVTLFLIASATYNLFLNLFNLLHRQDIYFAMTLGSAALILVFAVGFGHFGAFNSEYWFSGIICAYLLTGVGGALFFKKTFTQANSKTFNLNIRELSKFCLPLCAASIFMWGMVQGYRFPLEKMAGLETLGVLGLGLGIASSLTIYFEFLLQQLSFPFFYSPKTPYQGNQQVKAWKLTFLFYFSAALLFAVFLTVLSPQLIQLLAAEGFQSAGIYLAMGAWIEFIRLLGDGFNLLNLTNKTTMKTNYAYGLGVAALGVTMFVGIQSYPIEQVVPAAMLLGQATSFSALLITNLAHVQKLQWVKILRQIIPQMAICTALIAGHFFLFSDESLWKSLFAIGASSVLLLIGLGHSYNNFRHNMNN